MSLTSQTSPPPTAPVFPNVNEQIFNVDDAIVMSHDGMCRLLVAPVLSSINGTNQHHGEEVTSIIEPNVRFGPTISQENVQVNRNVENSSGTKRRRERTSKVWDDFTTYKDGKEWALCKHCKKKFVGESTSGTTHLKNHLERCPKKRDAGGTSDDKSIEASDSLNTSVVSKEKSELNQELSHLGHPRMFIKSWTPSLRHMEEDILKVFKEEKEKLQRYFSELPCHSNVTVESCNHADYSKVWCIVANYIDDRWKLKKRIIDLQDEEFDFFLVDFLRDWGLDKNESCPIAGYRSVGHSLSITGNCFIVDLLLERFKSGELTPWQNEIIEKLELLYDGVWRAISEKAGLRCFMDVIPKFELPEWAVRNKEEFGELTQVDLRMQSLNVESDWDKVAALYECSTVIKDIACGLSDQLANEYLSSVCDIFAILREWKENENHYVCEIAASLGKYFHECWNCSKLALVITAILDPRHKIEIVKRACREIYDDDADVHLGAFIYAVKNIYNKYANNTNKSESSTSGCGDSTSSTLLKKLHVKGRLSSSSQHVQDASPKSEFDRYLEDRKFISGNGFNILGWWSSHSPTYPILSRMARDFLSKHFSPSSKLLDSSLKSQILEIFDLDEIIEDDLKGPLACTKIWLNYTENE